MREWMLLTGGSGAIGQAIIRRLDGSGIFIVSVDRVPPLAAHPNVEHAPLDLEMRLDVRRAAAGWISRLGPPCYVVTAAGVYARTPYLEYSDDAFDRVFGSNFTGHFWLIHGLLPAMASCGKGQIVLITSQAAVTGGTDPAYAASKAALVALMKSIAREHGPCGISCNAVSPGPVDTSMAAAMGTKRQSEYKRLIPKGRFNSAEEVAATVCFLLEDSHGINGATIDVDGGLVRR